MVVLDIDPVGEMTLSLGDGSTMPVVLVETAGVGVLVIRIPLGVKVADDIRDDDSSASFVPVDNLFADEGKGEERESRIEVVVERRIDSDSDSEAESD